MINLLIAVLDVLLSVNHTHADTNPFFKIVKKSDLELVYQANWTKSPKGSHSVFFRYNKELLKKLKIKTGDKVYVIEEFNPETGEIYGNIWSGIDSLSFSVKGAKLLYDNEYLISRKDKAAIVNWKDEKCPNVGEDIRYVHARPCAIQVYAFEGDYKVCAIIL